MPYPVPPPEPSAIIYITKPKTAALIVAVSDRDTRSNSTEIPEPSPDIVLSEPTPEDPAASAQLLSPTVEAGQPPKIADPVATVGNLIPELRFQYQEPVEETATSRTQPDPSFTTYHFTSPRNLLESGSQKPSPEALLAQRKHGGNLSQGVSSSDGIGVQAKGQQQQLEDKAPPEPQEIPVPEPVQETTPSGQQQLEIPTPGTDPTLGTPKTQTTPKPQPKKVPAPGVRTAPSQRTVPFPVSPADTIEIKADRQEFDEKQQIVTAIGNVVVRFRQTVIDADRAIVNLVTRQVVASGNVAYTRGEQVVRGEKMDFNLGLNSGVVEQAKGELFLPKAGTELTPTLPTDVSAGTILNQPLSDRITSQQPVRGVRSPGAATFSIGGGGQGGQLAAPQITGAVNRVRFEAERLELRPDGVRVATNIRITNDPFSPPELEYRAKTATIRSISPTAQELVTTKPRLVFDNRVKIPVYPRRQVFDSNQQNGPCLTFGYDGGDRGGLYAECALQPFQAGPVRLTLTPQVYVQRVIEKHGGNPFFPDSYGLKAKLTAAVGPRTRIDGSAIFVNFDKFPNLAENAFRGNLRLRQSIGTHSLAAEYSYRDRLFNGSLGFQTVNSSLGAVLTSPIIPLGKSGVNLSYQAGYQFISADTDRFDLLEPVRDNNRIDLGRLQVSAGLTRDFTLWQGKSLPRTPTQGLKYTRTPVVPYVKLAVGIRGVGSYYSSDDRQNSLAGSVGIQGQFGHFSRPFLDYTGFNVTYTQVNRDGISPFLFDRLVDLRVLSFGLVQQVYGGFRVGIQSAINLDSKETISTNYTLEYSRRSYAIILRFNPERQVGSLTFRISDFNWNGTPEAFGGGDVRTVEGGVRLSD